MRRRDGAVAVFTVERKSEPMLTQIDLSSLPPDLGRAGFHDQPPYYRDMRGSDAEDAIAEIQLAMGFLLARRAVQTKTRPINSYALKHLIERTVRRYVPNGAAIAAAILLGHRVVPHRPLVNPHPPNANVFVPAGAAR